MSLFQLLKICFRYIHIARKFIKANKQTQAWAVCVDEADTQVKLQVGGDAMFRFIINQLFIIHYSQKYCLTKEFLSWHISQWVVRANGRI